MTKYKTGLVIGKFYPVHLGHQYLITSALEQCEHVTVLVMGTSFDTMDVSRRVRLIRNIFKDYRGITVRGINDPIYDDYNDPKIWEIHSHLIVSSLKETPEAVFTSESYGDELAGYLNARHICVDLERKRYPISATAVRRDMYKQWRFLPKLVQNQFRTNVVVMGAESTGTTTLSTKLAKIYRNRGGAFRDTTYVPEYGRAYAEDKIRRTGNRDIAWTEADFWDIATQQFDLYTDAMNNSQSPLIVNDTDSLATEAFAPYYGVPNDPLMGYGFYNSKADIYLITNHEDMPLEDDGSRLSDVEARNSSTQDFIDVCAKYNAPFALISGTRRQRVETSVKIIDTILSHKIRFMDPIKYKPVR